MQHHRRRQRPDPPEVRGTRGRGSACRGRSPSVRRKRGAESWQERLPALRCLCWAARGWAARCVFVLTRTPSRSSAAGQPAAPQQSRPVRYRHTPTMSSSPPWAPTGTATPPPWTSRRASRLPPKHWAPVPFSRLLADLKRAPAVGPAETCLAELFHQINTEGSVNLATNSDGNAAADPADTEARWDTEARSLHAVETTCAVRREAQCRPRLLDRQRRRSRQRTDP